jgi:hypothetical protein
MEPERLLPHSQVPATCRYPDLDRSTPCPPIPLPEDPSKYYRPIYTWVFQVVSFPQDFPAKPFIQLHCPLYAQNAPPTHSSRFGHLNNIG